MDDNTYSIYGKYFRGELLEGEKKTFEIKLENDPDFNEGYRLFTKAIQMISTTDVGLQLEFDQEIIDVRTDYKNKIKEMQKGGQEDPVHRVKIIPFYKKTVFKRMAAAVVLLAIIYTGSQLFYSREVDIDRLYADNDINAQSHLLTVEMIESRPRGYAALETLYLGLDNYKQKEYTAAIVVLTQYVESESIVKINTAYYFLGEGYRALETFDLALLNYHKINDNSQLYNHKYMSIALVLLKQNNKEAALEAASKVVLNEPNDTVYYKQASKLVEKLR